MKKMSVLIFTIVMRKLGHSRFIVEITTRIVVYTILDGRKYNKYQEYLQRILNRPSFHTRNNQITIHIFQCIFKIGQDTTFSHNIKQNVFQLKPP